MAIYDILVRYQKLMCHCERSQRNRSYISKWDHICSLFYMQKEYLLQILT